MPAYYFVPIPKIPKEFSHQNNTVAIMKYLVKEGQAVQPGTPLVIVQNWWAEFQIESTTNGIVEKTFFDKSNGGTYVTVGHPFAIITCDPEDAPAKDQSKLTLRKVLREKPKPQQDKS